MTSETYADPLVARVVVQQHVSRRLGPATHECSYDETASAVSEATALSEALS